MYGYVMIPGWLLAAKPSANAVLIYATLATFGTFDTAAGVYEECRPALASLAERAGMSVSNAKRGIAELLELGAITRRERIAEDGRTQLPSVYRVLFGSLVGPGGFAGGQGGESAGEQGGGSPASQDQEPPTQNQDTQKKTTSASPRGTRLPKDWLPDDALKLWAKDNAPGVGWDEHAVFVDYWIAQPGQKGVKTDWPATWRNWMRKESQRKAARPVSGGGRPQLFEQMREDRATDLRTAAQVADQIREKLPHLTVGEALDLARDMIDQAGTNTLSTSAATGYIEVEEIDGSDGPREVTG